MYACMYIVYKYSTVSSIQTLMISIKRIKIQCFHIINVSILTYTGKCIKKLTSNHHHHQHHYLYVQTVLAGTCYI